MHVYREGKWHRRTPDLRTTACGDRIDSERTPVRREQLAGDLCTECFTGHELATAAEANARDLDRTR